MSQPLQAMPVVTEQEVVTESGDPVASTVISLGDFIEQFGAGLLDAVRLQHPPVYDGMPNQQRTALMQALKRKPFTAQQDVVQAVTALLLDKHEPAAIINGEMGTGKSIIKYRDTVITDRDRLITSTYQYRTA